MSRSRGAAGSDRTGSEVEFGCAPGRLGRPAPTRPGALEPTPMGLALECNKVTPVVSGKGHLRTHRPSQVEGGKRT